MKITLYRALAVGEIFCVTSDYRDSIINEVYSRLLRSSSLGTCAFRCFTEDFRIALKYSKKAGYSGEIAYIAVDIVDGKVVDTGEYIAYRVLTIEDWLDLINDVSDLKLKNLNYSTTEVPFLNTINYSRGGARAYACADRTWLVHAKMPFEYSVLDENDIIALGICKRKRLLSFRALKHNKVPYNVQVALLDQLDAIRCGKAWFRNTERAVLNAFLN